MRIKVGEDLGKMTAIPQPELPPCPRVCRCDAKYVHNYERRGASPRPGTAEQRTTAHKFAASLIQFVV